jgi:glyoxylase-like metal-dependent hydrolase (beta-lactamase superfamily II)
MSAKVKVLVEGYTNADLVGETGAEKSCPTITLIKDGDIVMVVDPGVLENQNILIDALAREGLGVKDVDVVCITHSHIDHYRNVGMFPDAKVLEFFGVWEKNTVSEWTERFSSNIQIVATPGHNDTDITLFVTTEEGVVAICGDVFWREDYPTDPRDDMFASKPDQLKQSRKEVLKIADWIIPGHGPMFRAKPAVLPEEDNSLDADLKTPSKDAQFCKKCRRLLKKGDKCLCRPWLCYRCCECGMDCDNCSCSHHKK